MLSRSFFRAVLSICLVTALGGIQAALAQVLAPTVPESVAVSSERLERLTATLQQYVDDGQLAGAVALVARHGRVVYHEAVGLRDMGSRDAMRTDAIFRIASQTKALVSVAVMVLQEQGKLLISDQLSKHLPEFATTTVAVKQDDGGYQVEPSRRAITLRDLLTHTAGIDYGTGIAEDRWAKADIQGWYFAHRDETVRDTVSRMASLPFSAHPGERFVYGYNTDILGAVVERVSGQSLDAFLREAVLDPLGMDSTHFYLPPGKTGRLATVYSASGSGLERAPEPGLGIGQGHYVKGPRVSFSGGAGLLSTAMDYARFLQMMLNGGSLDGRRVLSRKSVELMTVDHLNGIPFRAGQGFGLGFSVVTDVGARGQPGSVGEFGWGGAYHSTYWVDPQEGLVVVYLTQLIPANGLDEHSKLRALVYQALTD
ncbi:MAG: serine hydrolase [Bryobacterales bacterium]|nr:serine hydrolase [Bryobacterales bacterium]MDE0620638.1 serine hydrolase [Bryobacterales bacterium]